MYAGSKHRVAAAGNNERAKKKWYELKQQHNDNRNKMGRIKRGH